MSDSGSPVHKPEEQAQSEHLNIKVTDNNNEVFFKIKRTTQLKKLMDAFCERQGKSPSSVRFLFDGTRVNPTDNPESVSSSTHCLFVRWLANSMLAGDARRRYPGGPSRTDWRMLKRQLRINYPQTPMREGYLQP